MKTDDALIYKIIKFYRVNVEIKVFGFVPFDWKEVKHFILRAHGYSFKRLLKNSKLKLVLSSVSKECD